MKTNFKNFANLFTFIFIALFAVSITSCGEKEDDPVLGCTDPTSENYNAEATIDDGSCEYARDKFIGTFNVVSDDCISWSYPISITASSQGVDKIIIGNIQGNSNLSVVGIVNGSSFVMEEKTFGNTKLTQGNGILSGDVLNLTFRVIDMEEDYDFDCSINANRG